MHYVSIVTNIKYHNKIVLNLKSLNLFLFNITLKFNDAFKEIYFEIGIKTSCLNNYYCTLYLYKILYAGY